MAPPLFPAGTYGGLSDSLAANSIEALCRASCIPVPHRIPVYPNSKFVNCPYPRTDPPSLPWGGPHRPHLYGTSVADTSTVSPMGVGSAAVTTGLTGRAVLA